MIPIPFLGSFLSQGLHLILIHDRGCRATSCMSDRRTVSSSDIADLVTALQDLTVAVTRIAHSSGTATGASAASFAEREGWEIVEEEYLPSNLSVPGGELVYLTSEQVAPTVPVFCYDLAKHRLTGASIGSAQRAERAFFAGRKAKEALQVGSVYRQAENIGLQPAHWIVVSSSRSTTPKRVTTKRDLSKLIVIGEEGLIWEQFASITELQIFCVGLGIAIPPLVRWKNRA